MKLTVKAPVPYEARSSWSEAAGELVVQPVFTGARDKKTVLYLSVLGSTGRERLFTLDISGSTGRLILTEFRETEPQFDLADMSPERESLVETSRDQDEEAS